MMEEGETGLELLISQDRRESADGIVSPVRSLLQRAGSS